MIASPLNLFITVFACICMLIPVHSVEFKLSPSEDSGESALNSIRPGCTMRARRTKFDPYTPQRILKTEPGSTDIKISKEWLKWQDQVSISLDKFIDKEAERYKQHLRYRKIVNPFNGYERPCEFVVNLNEKGNASSGLQKSSGSVLFNTSIFGTIARRLIPMNYPQNIVFKRVTIYGTKGLTEPYKITKIVGSKNYASKSLSVNQKAGPSKAVEFEIVGKYSKSAASLGVLRRVFAEVPGVVKATVILKEQPLSVMVVYDSFKTSPKGIIESQTLFREERLRIVETSPGQ